MIKALMVLLGLMPALPVLAEVDRASLVQVGASVLKIEVQRAQGGFSLGSGVVVGPGHIVTNCHVTQGAAVIHVLRGGVRWAALSQASDHEHDLCVLRVPGLRGQDVALGRSIDLKAGQSLTAVGYTGGLGIQSSAGNVVALHRHDGGHVIQSDNWFTSGASGGGLFDDQLRLVGVLTFRLRGGALHYFSAPVEWLQPLLDEGAAYLPVSATAARPNAYWQRGGDQQPHFLRAAALESEHKWAELEALAAQWSHIDISDPAPWYLRGLALGRMDRLPEALLAVEHSLAIEPAAGLVWLQLGLLLARQGETGRLQEVRRKIQALDPKLALEFDQRLQAEPGLKAGRI